MECKKHQGKIYLLYDIIPEEPPLHPNCRCSVQRLEAKTAGTATKIGLRGADWWLKTFRRLPDALGRTWYEADIHYSFGYRGGERILYSNDGSIFVTYDYYAAFAEIV